MGYRSDIAAAFYAANKKDFPVIKLWLMENFPVDTFHDNIQWFDRGLIVQDSHTKWYDSYPEVAAFDEAAFKFRTMFCSDNENTARGAYEFVRIGENYDDVETEYSGDCDYMIDVVRTIQIR